jgi:thiamine biosynthesis lipoprotein
MLRQFQTKIALGCEVTLLFVSADESNATKILFNELWIQIFEFENRFSRFLPSSELSDFNRQAGIRFYLSNEFKALLQAAKILSEETHGLYNPFILPTLQKIGYRKSMVAEHSTDDVDDFSHRSIATIEQLEIGYDWGRIPYNTAIDLGGCGKGYLADILAAYMEHTSAGLVSGYWFSLGGDIVAAGRDADNLPWKIYVEAAFDSTQITAEQSNHVGYMVASDDQRVAVATSSTLFRGGNQLGKKWHHIIDPRTGEPSVSGVVSASICDTSALRADVLASCAIIEGNSAVQTYTADYAVQGVLTQTKAHTIRAWGTMHKIKRSITSARGSSV